MEESLFNKKEFVTSASVNHSSSVIVKKNWQTPKLAEMDYSETSFGINPGPDGSINS